MYHFLMYVYARKAKNVKEEQPSWHTHWKQLLTSVLACSSKRRAEEEGSNLGKSYQLSSAALWTTFRMKSVLAFSCKSCKVHCLQNV